MFHGDYVTSNIFASLFAAVRLLRGGCALASTVHTHPLNINCYMHALAPHRGQPGVVPTWNFLSVEPTMNCLAPSTPVSIVVSIIIALLKYQPE